SAAREGFRVAVSQCWNVGSLSTEAQRTTVVVGVDMSREGRPVDGTLRLVSYEGGSQSAAQQAFEAARRAILRCGTDGYGLPAESYAHRRQGARVFNPARMRLRGCVPPPLPPAWPCRHRPRPGPPAPSR
ncbi:MAG: hypothetical protein N4A39_05640, partial [Roseicyclus sp.]|nr:hypothetical protein [Roseicyclus sp.]